MDSIEQTADEIAVVLDIEPAKIGVIRESARSTASVVLTDAQARRLLALALRGKENRG